MKIVLVSYIFLDGGGIEEHVYQLAKHYVAARQDVTVVSSDYLPTGEETIGRRARKIKGLKIHILKGLRTDFPPGRVQIPELLEYLVGSDCDIIHGHGMGGQVAQNTMLAAKIKDTPFVYTPHFQPAWVYDKLKARKIWEVIERTETQLVIRNSSACVAVSRPQKSEIIRYTKVSGDNIHIISNGVSSEALLVSRESISKVLEKYSIPESDHYMMFLGDVSNPRKGAFEAVQTFRKVREKMPNTHLIIVGPWGDRLKSSTRLLELINKMAKARYVTVTGYVTEQEKAALLVASDLLISPTVFEAFGIAIAESLLNGTPVVSTDVGGVPYVMRKNRDGYLVKDPSDIPALARACVRLLRDKRKAEAMGREGRDRVKRMFQWDRTADATLGLYKSLIKQAKTKNNAKRKNH